ncbi:ankyrin repeat domain-containing protein [Desulfoluna sp.]|uniref:ankyrin repeat domain-containing protein n=1 Tax=Desulfoluna sp. TaxID=2045199 RepID=UPI0026315D3A|nr:ankyrin repeat domain-containing protein [Desulfoluna sp.]
MKICDVHENSIAFTTLDSDERNDESNTKASATLDILKYIVEQGGEVVKGNDRGVTPLMAAMSTEVVEFLLDNGAEINARTDHGGTALHRAANNRKLAVAEALVNAGADLNFTEDYHGYSALHMAVDFNNIERVTLLVNHGINRDLKDHNGETALDLAKSKSKVNPTIVSLIEKGK